LETSRLISRRNEANQSDNLNMTQVNGWGTRAAFVAAICGALLLVGTARAIPQRVSQEAPASRPSFLPDAPVPQNAQNTQRSPAPNTNATPMESDQPIAPKNDRLFGVLPNYTTVENEDRFGPLSIKSKFGLATDSAIDPATFGFIGFVSLLGQAENTEPSYGQGLKGYAKRYGTSYGDAIIGTYMTTSVYPSALHQDPRYFQLGKGSIAHRTLYSVSRIFWTRTDSGSHTFNYSEIVGNLTAAGISNIYHPAEDHTVSNTLSVWGTDVMWDTVSNVAKEFWPDIRRKYFRRAND
jgi:hypothetical protein